MKIESLTPAEYKGFQKAYDFFNKELFGGVLPHVLVTLQRHPKARGYFSPGRFSGRGDVTTAAHELALNPDKFSGCTDEEILSTLVHEMTHVWQHCHDKPVTRCYHDRQWAAKMKEIGLQPSSTGAPGGKETGQTITHYIIPNGRYARAYAQLKARGFQLRWQSARAEEQSRAKMASKTKFTCPECGQNAWAKANAVLVCGNCKQRQGYPELCLMVAKRNDDAKVA